MGIYVSGLEGVRGNGDRDPRIRASALDRRKCQYHPCRFILLYQLSRGYMCPTSRYDTAGVAVMVV